MDFTKSQSNTAFITKGIDLVWREGFIAFESRKCAVNEIMEALSDEEISIVGIVGMGGIGKTKLVTEIGKNTKDEIFFNQAVMAVVSQTPNIRNIQGVLADMLDLQFSGKTEPERAMELHAALVKEKKVLVILDDVWFKSDMKDIGIPVGHVNGSCKVIITSRSEQACNDMGCSRKVHLEVINEAEAHVLFRNYAGLVDKSSSLDKLARKIVRECRGLPLALVVVGSALKDKSSEDYIDAVKRLADSNFVNIESADREIYPCLKLSYDYLHEETKKCFLLCSLFPEDNNIDLEKLTWFAVGQCMFQDVTSVEEARKRVFECVKKLEDACLLFPHQANSLTSHLAESPTIPWERLFGVKLCSLRMHDLVRDVALWIRKDDFLVPTVGELSQTRWRKKCANSSAISINTCDTTWEIPAQLECHNLKIMLLKQYPPLQPTCFVNMRNLQVLDITELEYFPMAICTTLPISLQHLHNLTALHIGNWICSRLGGLNVIKSLRKLEILSFRGSKIEGLPLEIKELGNLRVLDLTNCQCVRWIPEGILPHLTRLEELYTYTRSIENGGWGWPGNVHLSELKFLSSLIAFTACINSEVSFPPDFMFGDLLHYSVVDLPEDVAPIIDCSRNLSLKDLDPLSKQVLQKLLPQVGYLALAGPLQSFSNLFPQINDGNFENLTQLFICNPIEMKCLVFTAELSRPPIIPIFSNLVHLTLAHLPQLTVICEGPTPLGFLRNLKFYSILYCPQLQNAFPPRLSLGPKLATLDIQHCTDMKYAFELEPEEFKQGQVQVPTSKIVLLSSLQNLTRIWELPHRTENLEPDKRELRVRILEALTGSLNSIEALKIIDCNQLEEVFQLLVEVDNKGFKGQMLNLVKLELRGLCQLKYICKPLEKFYFRKLERIEVDGCDRLTSLFTPTTAQGLQKLQFITIVNCKALQRLIACDEIDAAACPGSYLISFPYLRRIDIGSCDKLKGTLPISSVAQGLPKLENISLQNCINLEYVFGDGTEYVGESLVIMLNNLQSLTLEGLPRLVGLSPMNCHVVIPSLHELKVDEWPANYKLQPSWLFNHAPIDEQELSATSSLVERLIAVEKIILQNSQQVLELFNLQGVPHQQLVRKPWFSRLTYLELAYLPFLTHIWKGPTHSVSLGNLTKLRVNHCQSLLYLFTPTLARTLSQLNELKVSNCENLESLIAEDFLTETKNNLDYSVAEPFCFQELVYFSAGGCHKLTRLFPLSMVPSLPKLVHLDIRVCHKLERIFDDDEGAGIENGNLVEMELPQLVFLHLVELPSLKCFAPPNQRVICPGLFSLSLRCFSMCAALDTNLETPMNAAPSLNIGNPSQFSLQPQHTSIFDPNRTFMLPEAYDSLLSTSTMDSLDMLQPDWKDELHYEHGEPENFKKFNGILPITEARSINILQHVVIENSTIEEVFDLERFLAQDQKPLFLLEALTLRDLPNLKCIWKACPKLIFPVHLSIIYIHNCKVLKSLFTYDTAKTLFNLTVLDIRNCEELEYIFDPKDPFSYVGSSMFKLRQLSIVGCDKLKIIFPVSIAQSLSSLEGMLIKGASQLEEIFCEDQERGENEEVRDIILLPKLWFFTLIELPKLTRLVPLSYDLNFGSPVLLHISKCRLLSRDIVCSWTTMSSMLQASEST